MAGPVYFNTVERAIRQAYENCALIGLGQTPSSEQYASGLNRLNDMVNHWQTRGLKLMTLTDVVLTSLSVATNFYPLGPGQSGLSITKPMRVFAAYYQTTTGSVTTLTASAWTDWILLPNKLTSPGQPINYFVDKQAAFLGLYLWPICSSTTLAGGTIHLVLQNQITNATGLTDATGLPPEWFRALSWGLADEISVGQPQEIIQRCKSNAMEYRTDLENWDVEDAQTYFTVDTQGGNYGSSFR